jgi:hypothetical protein
MAAKSPQHLLGCAFVVDAICRRSMTKFADKDRFSSRFAVNLRETVAQLQRCPESDRPALDRVLKLWKENGVIVEAGGGGGAGGATSSSGSGATSSSGGGERDQKRARSIPSPHTPPGLPGPSNFLPAAEKPIFASQPAPPLQLALGAPPPMMGAPPPLFLPISEPHASIPPPPMISVDFDYDDDRIVTTEQAISDAKRRRLEQERRVNEIAGSTGAANNSNANPNAPTVSAEILREVEGLLDQPEQLMGVLEAAGLTLQELIVLLQNAPGTQHIVGKLTLIGIRQTNLGGAGRPQMHQGRKCAVRMSTTVYVGNLSSVTTEEEIRTLFRQFGTIDHFSHRPDLGTAFVSFTTREEAETAQTHMDHFPVRDQQIRTGWARGPDMREGDFDKRTGLIVEL